MDSTKLWLKISGSITYYFKSYPTHWTPENLWIDFLNYALPDEGAGIHTYLDKQTMKRVEDDIKGVELKSFSFDQKIANKNLSPYKLIYGLF